MSDDFAAAGRIEQSAIPVIDTSRALDGADVAGVAAQVMADAVAVVGPCDLGVSAHDSIYAPVTAGAHIASRNKNSFAQFNKG
ncbi:hypothetical protein ABMC88_08730 [Sulfitobacter sp. HNIBRBA2951]|uniref:hypothetical protein n=1 Tax=Sulfitobacter aquimarinus TaxID=3158557 RepID=UPI0032DFA744